MGIFLIIPDILTFSGYHDGSYNAGQQQNTDGFKGQEVLVLIGTHHRTTDVLHGGFLEGNQRHDLVDIVVDDMATNGQTDCCSGACRKQALPGYGFGLISGVAGKQDGKDIEYHNTTGIDRNL